MARAGDPPGPSRAGRLERPGSVSPTRTGLRPCIPGTRTRQTPRGRPSSERLPAVFLRAGRSSTRLVPSILPFVRRRGPLVRRPPGLRALRVRMGTAHTHDDDAPSSSQAPGAHRRAVLAPALARLLRRERRSSSPEAICNRALGALDEISRALVALGVSANAITSVCIAMGIVAGVLLSLGYFGVAGIVMVVGGPAGRCPGRPRRRSRSGH